MVLSIIVFICHTQLNVCMINNRETTILLALQSPKVGWEAYDLQSMLCMCHIALNINKKFKTTELKRQLINMGIYIP